MMGFSLLLLILQFVNIKSTLKPIIKPIQVGNLKMSPIGSGTWAWGNQFLWGYSKEDDIELQQVFDYTISNGINWFDTADSYGTGSLNGRSESLLGKFASRYDIKKQKQFYFCTKIAPFPWRIGKNSMKNSFYQSKERMQRQVDMLQLHWPPTLGWQEIQYLDAFSELVNNKDAIQIGMSNFGSKGLKRVNKILQDKGTKIYTNQVQFSLLSRGPLTSGLTDTCEELDIQPISYSPLALGLLTDKYTLDRLPSGPRGILFREYLPVIQPLLNELRDIAKKRNKTVAQVALNWNLQKGFLVLVGIRSVSQAKENLGSIGWSLSAAEVLVLDIVAAKVPKQLIQNPNQSN